MTPKNTLFVPALSLSVTLLAGRRRRAR